MDTQRNLQVLLRKSICGNFKKKSSALKNYKKKILSKRQEILEDRRRKLEQFRIDYLPLCLEEDLIRLANSKG